MSRIIDGTSGPDTLFGDFRNGTLHGKGASQTLNGLGGDDTLYETGHELEEKQQHDYGNCQPRWHGRSFLLCEHPPLARGGCLSF